MTLRRRRLATVALAVAGPLVYYMAIVPFWRGFTGATEETAFDFTINPFIPWLNGEDAEEDVVVLLAMRKWLNNNAVDIGHG